MAPISKSVLFDTLGGFVCLLLLTCADVHVVVCFVRKGHMLRDGSVRYEDLQHGGDGGAAAGGSD